MKSRFLEALDKIVGTERRIKYTGDKPEIIYSGWAIYNADEGNLEDTNGTFISWPPTAYQKEIIWEIEDEPIYVWGKCDDDNVSLIFTDSKAEIPKSDSEYDDIAFCEKEGLFPKDKPQKFRLVPVEDKE